jgi:hypothetical protein
MRDTGPAGGQSKRSRWALGVALAVACAGEQGAPPAAAPEAPVVETSHPDVVLITIDTLRADRVGAYGDPLAATPQLDALARRALLFREAHAVAPLTLPSHATLLTGRAPSTHGLRDNGAVPLGDQVRVGVAVCDGLGVWLLTLRVPEGVVVEVGVPEAAPVVVDHTTAASLIATKPWPELLPIGGCHTGEPVNGVPPVPATQAALVKAPVQDVPPEPAV